MSTKLEKILKALEESPHLFRNKRVTKQVRISKKLHIKLKGVAGKRKITISKLLDEIVENYL